MIKVLQKYKMYVLVVAGVLIMISFLLADALKQIGTYSHDNERIYTVDGQKVTRSDLQKAAIHLDGLKRVVNNELMKRLNLDDDSTQWQLAAAAAERAGLVGGPADGRALAQVIASQSMMREFGTEQAGYTDWKKNLMERMGINEEQADARISQLTETYLASAGRTGNASYEGSNAFAEYKGLMRLMQSYGDVPQTSENRMAAEARRLLDVAVIKYVYVPLTEARIAAAPAPTAEEMQAQFDKFKDTPVGTGENGAGYRQNDRITYTWFSIDKAAISKAVKIDPVEVQKRALTRVGDGKVDPVVRRQIEDEIRGEQTQRAIDDFTSALRTEFLRNSALLPDKDGYKALPADWKKPDIAAAVAAALQRLAADKKSGLPAPQVHVVATPQDARAFIQEKDIGTTMLARPGQQALFLRDVLFGAKELGKPAGKVAAQIGLPIPTPFTGRDGNLYFVMLDSAIPSATPKSLDEVRAEVEKDLRKTKALATLKNELDGVLAPIMMFGMTDAPTQLEKLGYPGLAVQSGLAQRFMMQSQGQGIFSEQGLPGQREVQDTGYIDAILTRAEKLDPSLKVAPDTAPDRTFVYPFSSSSGVALTQITGLRPLTQETFRLAVADPRFRVILESKEMSRADVAPFKTDSLIKRLNVVGVDRTKKNDEGP